MDRFGWWLLAAVVVLSSAGCRGMSGPNWFHPGSAQYQQARAHQFDPYPEVGSGPPVSGSRPQGFQTPPPEVQRVHQDQLRRRWFPWQWEWGWQ